MKIKNIFLAIIILLVLNTFISCSDDKDNPSPETVTLRFTKETNQDQMGDFAYHAMALFNSKVWSAAGINTYSTPNLHDDVWYSNNGVSWLSVADNFFKERRGTTLTLFNDKLWIIAGESNEGNTLDDIWSSTDGEHWTLEVTAAPFGPVKFHSTVVFNNKLFVIAGDQATEHTKVWSSVNGIDWVEETSNAADAFFGRGGHATVVFNNTLYVIGGESTTRLNDVWKSTNGRDWTQVAIQGGIFPRITSHTATVYNDKVWVIGGRISDSAMNNDIYFSSDMLNWNKYEIDDSSSLLPIFEGRANHQTLNYNNALWVFGGIKKTTGITGEIWSIKEE